MNKNQELFTELQKKFAEIIFNKYESQISNIAKIQKMNKDTILKEIADVLLKYSINNNILDLSYREKLELKQNLNKLINNTFTGEYDQEKENINDLLGEVANDKYYTNCYLYNLGVNYTLKPVKQNVLNKIINSKIKGENYSERIWNNKNQTAKQIKKEVNDFLNGKTTVNQINSRISRRFDVNWTNSNRLARTEIAKVQTQANEYWCKEHKIQQQMFTATLDSKTSSLCQNYDGKMFSINDKTKPIPPLHPNCRSCLINVVDGWQPKQRLNNKTKERIDYKSYKEWKDEKGDNNTHSEKPLNNMVNNLKKLNATEYTNRKALGKDILKTLGLNDIPVHVKKIKDHGYCRITNNNKVIEYTLNSGDLRGKEYQIKTSLHEAYHAKANNMNSDRLSIGKKWIQIEETFAESSAHYMAKEMGVNKEIAPSYSSYLIDTLPRLKQLDKFKNCESIADFGKIAWQDRLNGVEPTWEKLYNECMDVKHNWKDYSKQYFSYIDENKEELVEKMLENMPNYKEFKNSMVKDIDGAIKNLTYNNSLSSNQDMVLSNVLAITINRVGVK